MEEKEAEVVEKSREREVLEREPEGRGDRGVREKLRTASFFEDLGSSTKLSVPQTKNYCSEQLAVKQQLQSKVSELAESEVKSGELM